MKNDVFTTLANVTLPLFQRMLPYLQDMYNYWTGNWADSIDRIKTGGLQSRDDMDIILKHSAGDRVADLADAIKNTKPEDRDKFVQGGNYSAGFGGGLGMDWLSGRRGSSVTDAQKAVTEVAIQEALEKNKDFSMQDAFGKATPQGRSRALGYTAAEIQMFTDAQKRALTAPTSGSSPSIQQQGNGVAPVPTPQDTDKSNYEQMNRRNVDALPPGNSTITPKSDDDTTSTETNKNSAVFADLSNTQLKLTKSIDKLLLTLNDGITVNLDGKKVSSALTTSSNNKSTV